MPMLEHTDSGKPEPGAQRRGGRGVGCGEPRVSVLAVPDPRLSRSSEFGLALLGCYSGERRELGIAELAEIVGVSRSTTHRYAVSLVQLVVVGGVDLRFGRRSTERLGE